MASVSFLPKVFRWAFTVLTALAALVAICVFLVMAINPSLPQGTHLGPADVEILGQPGTVSLLPAHGDFDATVSTFRGTITLVVAQAGQLIDVLKQYGLPVLLIEAIFLAVLFELLRRLFRNVGRGDSFSVHTVRLVQMVGGVLILFSFASSFAEGLFVHAVYGYFANHAVITISGSHVQLPAASYVMFPSDGGFPSGSPLFFSGLLVLALSEVFRQGLALKNENELTI